MRYPRRIYASLISWPPWSSPTAIPMTLIGCCSGECGMSGTRVWWVLLAYDDGLIRIRCARAREMELMESIRR